MLSIIIPVFNVEQYLERCLNSILSQSYKDWEIILIDDGSTDKSGDICDQYARENNKIKAFHQQNQGVSAARNKGIENASGSHIVFIDADDWIEPTMLSEMMTGNDYDMVVCNFTLVSFDENGQLHKQKSSLWKHEKRVVFESDEVFHDVFCTTATLWNKIFCSSVIGDVRFDTSKRYGEDAFFLCNVLRRVKKCKLLNKPLYNYYFKRDGNVVSAAIDSRSFDFLKNAQDMYNITVLAKQPTCGVCRIFFTMQDVWSKIDDYRVGKDYIDTSIKVMRVPSFSHIFRFILDSSLPISFKARFSYPLYILFPKMLYKYKSARRI